MLIKLMFAKLGQTLSGSLGKMGLLLALLLGLSLYFLPEAEGWSILEVLWWFPVTITTVGYGDFYPESLIGRAIALLVMFGGIGVYSLLITGIASSITKRKAEKMNGSGKVKGKEHIVIFGWIQDKTPALIEEIRSDKTYLSKKIVLCSDCIEENPLPDQVTFIKGKLSSQDVMVRCSIQTASKAIIYTRDDEKSLCTALSLDALSHEFSQLPIVVYIQSDDYRDHLENINLRRNYINKMSIVTPSSISLIAQEMQDPGVSEIVQTLISNKTDRTIFKIPVTKMKCYQDCIASTIALKGIVPIAYEDSIGNIVCYPEDTTKSCTAIFVVASERPILDL